MARVLVVEDDPDLLEAMSLLLHHKGYEVDTAANGRDALAFVVDKTPDVLLLDLALPEMNGVKLVETVRSYRRLAAIPVIFLTALSSGRLFEEAKWLNVSSMLLKGSTTADQIKDAIDQALKPNSGGRSHPPEKWRGDSISPL